MALSLEEWRLLVTAMAYLPLNSLLLQKFGFSRTQQLLRSRSPQKTTYQDIYSDPLAESRKVARMVLIARNYGFYRANCLNMSLVLWSLLQQRGIDSGIRFGVNIDESNFNAHAWVEYQGNPLIDTADVEKQFSSFG